MYLASSSHRPTRVKRCDLRVGYALRRNVNVHDSWQEEVMADEEYFYNLSERHHQQMRTTETT